MNPAPESRDWLDEVECRRLTPEEIRRLRQDLSARPREAARLAEELALNALLDGGPRPEPASNFTSRVLAAVAAAEPRRDRAASGLSGWLRSLRLARVAAFATTLAVVTVAWWQVQGHRRGVMAASVVEVTQVAAVPGVEVLENFEAIRLLRTTAQPGDVEVLLALSEAPVQ